MRVISVKIEDELFEKVEIFALNKRISRSEAMRIAVEKFLASEMKTENGK